MRAIISLTFAGIYEFALILEIFVTKMHLQVRRERQTKIGETTSKLGEFHLTTILLEMRLECSWQMAILTNQL